MQSKKSVRAGEILLCKTLIIQEGLLIIYNLEFLTRKPKKFKNSKQNYLLANL